MIDHLNIISGGQTGADRAALDWAIRHGIAHAGWCPKGRKALDGTLDPKYQLQETPSSDYPQRTEWNVRDSDATVVFTLAPVATGGSKKTLDFAAKYGRPSIHLHTEIPHVAERLRQFLVESQAKRLNIAGSRESKEPGIFEWVTEVLDHAFASIEK